MGQAPPGAECNKERKGTPFIKAGEFGIERPIIVEWTTKPLKLARRNDTLLCVVGATSGKVNKGEDCAIGRSVAAIRADENKLDKDYLYRFVCSWTKRLRAMSQGAAQTVISKEMISNLQIPLPPLAEQQRIAKILDAADSLRKKTQQIIDSYDELAQSVFLDMFGDPVKNEKGWELKTIEKLVKNQKHSIKRGPFGGALKKEIFVEKGYLVYEQFHALNRDFNFERYYIDEFKFQELKAFEVKSKDIIISCSGVYLGKLAIVPLGAKKGIINQALLKITLDESKMANEFFVFHFSHKNFRNKFFDATRGAGIPNFPPIPEFKKFPFICPPINIQNQFIEKIQLIDKQKELAKQSLKESDDLFNALLQKAFKGEFVS